MTNLSYSFLFNMTRFILSICNSSSVLFIFISILYFVLCPFRNLMSFEVKSSMLLPEKLGALFG